MCYSVSVVGANMEKIAAILILFISSVIQSNNKFISSSNVEEKTPVLYCFECNSEEDPNCEEGGGSGRTVDCPVTGACVISTLTEPGKEEVFFRSCAPIRNTLQCNIVETEDRVLRYCNCDQDLCNWDWESAGYTTDHGQETTALESLSCYSCHNASGTPGACTESFPGEEVACPKEGGCVIKIQANDGMESIFSRGCDPNILDSDIRCDRVDTGETSLQFCNCKTDLCNENWATAGSTTSASTETTKTTTEPGLVCYSCSSSLGDECDDDHPGEEMTCEEESVCVISVYSQEGAKDLYSRSCASHDHGMEVECGTTVTDTSTLVYCNCATDRCNQDWNTAGYTTTLPAPETTSSTTLSTISSQTTVSSSSEQLNPRIIIQFASVFLLFLRFIYSNK